MFDPRKFWLDPDGSDQAPEVKAMCRPEFYLGLDNVTQLVVYTILAYVPRNSTILEIGCGTGRNLAGLKRAGYHFLSGVEINPAAIMAGRKAFSELASVNIECMPVEDYDIPDTDCIFTQGVLMHLPPSSEFVFERIAKRARVLITIENEIHPTDRAWARDYGDIFTGLGLTQFESHTCETWPPLPEETILRVFAK